MAKLNYINEVDALRGVFYRLFETRNLEHENTTNKVLVFVSLVEK